MKANFKQLGLATAVAAATVGYAGITQAAISSNGLGDMAIVPYYTVEGDFVSGLHITNTSDATQVVKLRWRRGSDSMDALDFNIIMSPHDVWTGFIDDSSGGIVVKTDDTTCTAPLRPGGDFPMPGLYASGAEEGYIEIIGMAQHTDGPMAAAALHAAGVPADCGAVESNFFRVSTTAPAVPAEGNAKGVYSSIATVQTLTAAQLLAAVPSINNFEDTPNVLKVSYFIRDAASGLEFGSDAVHIQDFAANAMMTNQEIIILGVPDAYSFLFPDMDGGSPLDTARGSYDGIIRAADGLGALSVINDWSVASARNVSTDWVVTLPGQYLMLDLTRYTLGGADGTDCPTAAQAAALVPASVECNARDIPVVLDASNGVWDREEGTFIPSEGGLVISPEVGLVPNATILPFEVNVIEWTAGSNEPVLG
ncbi:MAG: hypothetical protein IMF06_15825, partial [Proteobacteria bacterium]|nr:hypothetical protein [Pseudomonadota bacterium]